MWAWLAGMKDLTEAQIVRGVESLANWTKPFPPGLGQFRELCLATAPAYHDRYEIKKPLLEHLASMADSEIAKRELDRMRRIKAGEDVETFHTSYHNCGLGKRWPGKLPR